MQIGGSWFRSTKVTFECRNIHVQIHTFSFSLTSRFSLPLSSSQIPICIYTLLPIYRLALIFYLLRLSFSSLPVWLNVCNPICGVGGNMELTMWIVHLFLQYINITHTCARPTHFAEHSFDRISSLKWQTFCMCVSLKVYQMNWMTLKFYSGLSLDFWLRSWNSYFVCKYTKLYNCLLELKCMNCVIKTHI